MTTANRDRHPGIHACDEPDLALPRGRAAVLAVVVALALSGCSSSVDLSKAESQLSVGTRAAKDGLWGEALFRFTRAVELAPDNAMALNNLGVACEGAGEFEKARDAYTRALARDRGNEYIQKNYSRFNEFYTRYKKLEPKKDVPPAEPKGDGKP